MADELSFEQKVRKNDSFTSPVPEDELLPDGTYMWDCCNADYCKKYAKADFKLSCLRASSGCRCSFEEKRLKRETARSKGFTFPDFQDF